MQVPNGTGLGVRRSKRPLLASRTRCNVLWKPPKFGNKVKIGIKVQFGNKFANWCNVWSIEGVIVYWTVLRLNRDDLWLVQWNNNRLFIKGLWIWVHGLSETLVNDKSHKTFLEIFMGSPMANRKWPCYLENWDSPDVNNLLVHFWSHLQPQSNKRLTYAQHFLNLVSSVLRHHFALHAIVFLVNWYWQLDFKWKKTKLFVFVMHSK